VPGEDLHRRSARLPEPTATTEFSTREDKEKVRFQAEPLSRIGWHLHTTLLVETPSIMENGAGFPEAVHIVDTGTRTDIDDQGYREHHQDSEDSKETLHR
jgi:hypothetical protein